MRRTLERMRKMMERVTRRMTKKMHLKDQEGREQLKMMMMKTMKLKPRNRREISRVSSACSFCRRTPSRDSQFSANLQHLSPPFLTRILLKRDFVCILFTFYIFVNIVRRSAICNSNLSGHKVVL